MVDPSRLFDVSVGFYLTKKALTSTGVGHQSQTPRPVQPVCTVYIHSVWNQQIGPGDADLNVQIVICHVHHIFCLILIQSLGSANSAGKIDVGR